MASSFSTPGGPTTTPSSTPSLGTGSSSTGSGSAGGLREELTGDAKSLADTATQRLEGEVDARKGGAVSQVQSLSSALGETAQKLSDDTPSWLRSALEQGAQTLDQFAQSIEQKDARTLGRDAQRLARENPGTFLAGCTLAGFLAARVFKAGAGAATGGSSARSEFSADAGSSYVKDRQPADDSGSTPGLSTFVPEAVS